jgi:hypothetical protein
MRSVKKSWLTIDDVLEFWRSDYDDHDELKTLLMKKLSLLSKKITDVHALADNIKQKSAKSFAIGDVWYLVESNWFRSAAKYLGIDPRELTPPKEVVVTTTSRGGAKKESVVNLNACHNTNTGGSGSSGSGGGNSSIVRRDSARSSDSHPRQSGGGVGGLESRRGSCQSTDSEGREVGGLSGSQHSLIYDEAGMDCFFPGPIDNSRILKEGTSNEIKDHMKEHHEYELVPDEVWNLLEASFGLTEGQKPIARIVREFGMLVKTFKVEVYYTELVLAEKARPEQTVRKGFSKADTIAKVEAVMKEVFSIPYDAETRLWHKYTCSNMER